MASVAENPDARRTGRFRLRRGRMPDVISTHYERRPEDRRRLRLLLAAMTVACVAFCVMAPAARATPDYDWPGMKKCGTFHSSPYTIWVYAKHITCRTARRIQKEYWLAPDDRRVIHNGGTGASGWVTLKRFPHWRCSSGAGAGQCTRGHKAAGYQN
jgi:hypothetical protein